jgi:7-carboxy-7-deazaguanine synthase (Cx14CxxC type)
LSYVVKELFYTLQGEGGQAGRPAVFLRFAGCNLWSGREQDRASAQCRFCDTDFVGGDRYGDAATLVDAVAALWPDGGAPYVVCTGGEPSLQLDAPLIDALHAKGFEVAIETNGTRALPAGVDWVCVSPKAGTDIVVTSGDELKLVWPQVGLDPAALEGLAFHHHFLQPMDGPDRAANTQACIQYCLTHPRWRLSLQTHKILGIP